VGIEGCRLVELPVVENRYGDLAFAEGGRHVPFDIERVFYVYDVPGDAVRGGHAHRSLEEVVFCLVGGFSILVDDGTDRRSYRLEDRRVGLYLPPMVWHDIVDFAPGTAYVALTSAPYDEAEYIRDRDEYLSAVGAPVARS
jgi:dTDP-4-dehydrorhamnose 3,5-epimerase-like enzyme